MQVVNTVTGVALLLGYGWLVTIVTLKFMLTGEGMKLL